MKKNILAFLLLSFSLAHATPPEQPTVNPAPSKIESLKASIAENKWLLLKIGIGIAGFTFCAFQLCKNSPQTFQTREMFFEKERAFLINHAKVHPEYFALKTTGLSVNPPVYPQELIDLGSAFYSQSFRDGLLLLSAAFFGCYTLSLLDECASNPTDDNNSYDIGWGYHFSKNTDTALPDQDLA